MRLETNVPDAGTEGPDRTIPEPYRYALGGVFTGLMFVVGEALVDVRFDTACAMLASVLHDDVLLTASQDAYTEAAAGLAQAGPVAPVSGVSRLAEVKFREPLTCNDSVVVTLRWEAIGPGGELFPALDADLTLVPAGPGATSLRLTGAYRPPLDGQGARLDQVILRGVSAALAQRFVSRIGAAVAEPAPGDSTSRGKGRRTPPPDAAVS